MSVKLGGPQNNTAGFTQPDHNAVTALKLPRTDTNANTNRVFDCRPDLVATLGTQRYFGAGIPLHSGE